MYRTLLVASFLAIVALAFSAAGVAIWGAGEARYHLQRVEFANAVLHDQLDLKADTYALLRRLSDSLGDDPPGRASVADEERERAAILGAVDRIRTGIAREIAFTRRREDELEELLRLAEIERGLLFLLAQYRQALTLLEVGRAAEGRRLFEDSLRELTGEGFRRLFDDAIAEEEQETRDAQAEAAAALRRVTLAGQVGGAAAALLAAAALTVLLGRLRRPLSELVEAAQAVAAGNLDRRVRLEQGRRDEFAGLAASFNAMIEEVARGRRGEAEARRMLEEEVASRTAELARANEELRRADALRRRFLADVSHELRTPLTVIRGEAEVTLRGEAQRGSDEYRDVLGRIADQAAHTARLVDDLLFVARAEAGEPRLSMQAVALDHLVRRCVDDVEALARDTGVGIVFGESAGDVTVQGDPGRLRQAFIILLDNAVRYTERGKPVEVSLLPTPAGVAVRVADRGIGIAEEELPHIFDRFWRGARAAERHAGGSGLGLPLAKSIVEAHGGAIGITSRVGEGTAVTVTLPVVRRVRAVA
jgi:two-component system OmpR family sensor kinase